MLHNLFATSCVPDHNHPGFSYGLLYPLAIRQSEHLSRLDCNQRPRSQLVVVFSTPFELRAPASPAGTDDARQDGRRTARVLCLSLRHASEDKGERQSVAPQQSITSHSLLECILAITRTACSRPAEALSVQVSAHVYRCYVPQSSFDQVHQVHRSGEWML